MIIRGIKGGNSLRELMAIADLPLSCTIGDWLRRMGEDERGLSGLGKVNHHLVREVVLGDKQNRGQVTYMLSRLSGNAEAFACASRLLKQTREPPLNKLSVDIQNSADHG